MFTSGNCEIRIMDHEKVLSGPAFHNISSRFIITTNAVISVIRIFFAMMYPPLPHQGMHV